MTADFNSFEFAALFFSSLFAGASVYISLVEHPARMERGGPVAVGMFAPSYRRASRLMASLAVLGFAGGFLAWQFGSGRQWLVGALLLVSVVPFTLVAVMPANARLMDSELDPHSPEAARLLARWGRLQAVRTLLALAALVTFLLAR
jgi:uncharacterized membrane protein